MVVWPSCVVVVWGGWWEPDRWLPSSKLLARRTVLGRPPRPTKLTARERSARPVEARFFLLKSSGEGRDLPKNEELR